jgi:membrane protease YdiL (CAAX protease family)
MNNAESGHIWQDIIVVFMLMLFSILCLLIKHIVTSEPIVEAGDFYLLSFEKILLFVLIYPVVEEFVFRGFLLFYNRRYVFTALLFVLFFISSTIKPNCFKHTAIFATLLFFLLLLFSNGFHSSITEFIDRNKLTLVYITSIIFGIFHITNYESFSPIDSLFIFHKILSGLFFSYIIVKYNSPWPACFFHAMNNAIPTIILYFGRSRVI